MRKIYTRTSEVESVLSANVALIEEINNAAKVLENMGVKATDEELQEIADGNGANYLKRALEVQKQEFDSYLETLPSFARSQYDFGKIECSSRNIVENLIKHLLSCRATSGQYLFRKCYIIENGVARLRDNAKQEIEDICSIWLRNEEHEQIYNAAVEVADKLNELQKLIENLGISHIKATETSTDRYALIENFCNFFEGERGWRINMDALETICKK